MTVTISYDYLNFWLQVVGEAGRSQESKRGSVENSKSQVGNLNNGNGLLELKSKNH